MNSEPRGRPRPALRNPQACLAPLLRMDPEPSPHQAMHLRGKSGIDPAETLGTAGILAGTETEIGREIGGGEGTAGEADRAPARTDQMAVPLITADVAEAPAGAHLPLLHCFACNCVKSMTVCAA